MDITNILALTEGLARQIETSTNTLVINAVKAIPGTTLSVFTEPLTGSGTPGGVTFTAADASQLGGAVGNGGSITIQSGLAANPSQTGGNAGLINMIWSNGNSTNGVVGYFRTSIGTAEEWVLNESGIFVANGNTFGSIGGTANFLLGGTGFEWTFDGSNSRMYLTAGTAIEDGTNGGNGDGAIIGGNNIGGDSLFYPFHAMFVGSGGLGIGTIPGNVYDAPPYQLDVRSDGTTYSGTASARFAVPANYFTINLSGNISTSVTPNQITGLSSTSQLAVNMGIAGTGIQGGTVILEIIDMNTVLMSLPAISTGNFPFTFSGITSVSGLLVGVDSSGNGSINNQQNLPINFSTNNTLRWLIDIDGGLKSGLSGTYSVVPASSITSTTDATTTTVAIFATTTNSVTLIETRVVGYRTGGSAGTTGDSAYFIVRCRVKNVAGTVTIYDQIKEASADQPAWDVNFTVDGVTTTQIDAQVTGAVNNNIDWTATIITTQVL